MIAAIPLITSALSALSSIGSAAPAAPPQPAAGGDFGQVMSKVTADAVNSLKGAEATSMDGIEGKANVQAVVQSVMTAQEQLQTALAIRDKAVAALQEVTRMAI